jgi:hypothetical protein
MNLELIFYLFFTYIDHRSQETVYIGLQLPKHHHGMRRRRHRRKKGDASDKLQPLDQNACKN